MTHDYTHVSHHLGTILTWITILVLAIVLNAMAGSAFGVMTGFIAMAIGYGVGFWASTPSVVRSFVPLVSIIVTCWALAVMSIISAIVSI